MPASRIAVGGLPALVSWLTTGFVIILAAILSNVVMTLTLVASCVFRFCVTWRAPQRYRRSPLPYVLNTDAAV